MKDLLDIRKEIDGIDRQIVELFENRMVLTTQVAKFQPGRQYLIKRVRCQN